MDDWQDFEPGDPRARPFCRELKKELSRGHQLFGLDVSVVARRFAQDDILVSVRGRPGIAVVHLTWRRKRDTPPWPMTTWFDSVEAAKAARKDD
ncbi:hypothetical protein [Schumannella luteola]